MPNRATGRNTPEIEQAIARIKKQVQSLTDPRKMRAEQRDREKTDFVRRAKAAGFTEKQAIFLYENVLLLGHDRRILFGG